MAQFELYCEYIHCCGKKVIKLGEADGEKIAKAWFQEQTINKKRPKLQRNDIIRTCPVIHCPAKLQIPRYNYRKKAV